MIALSSSSLSRLPAAIRVPGCDRLRLHPGIVHIGVGSFRVSPARTRLVASLITAASPSSTSRPPSR
jgi:hypothetical protein